MVPSVTVPTASMFPYAVIVNPPRHSNVPLPTLRLVRLTLDATIGYVCEASRLSVGIVAVLALSGTTPCLQFTGLAQAELEVPVHMLPRRSVSGPVTGDET